MSEFVLIICLCVGALLFGALWMFADKRIYRIRTRISFKRSLDKSELVIIPLYNGEKKLNFIVDSGSTCNIIDSNVLKELITLKEDIDTSKIESISVGGLAKTESVVSMMLSSKNEKFFETFFVMDMKDSFGWSSGEYGEEVHGLLGTDFLKHYGKIIDFNNYTIYSK